MLFRKKLRQIIMAYLLTPKWDLSRAGRKNLSQKHRETTGRGHFGVMAAGRDASHETSMTA